MNPWRELTIEMILKSNEARDFEMIPFPVQRRLQAVAGLPEQYAAKHEAQDHYAILTINYTDGTAAVRYVFRAADSHAFTRHAILNQAFFDAYANTMRRVTSHVTTHDDRRHDSL